MNNILAACLLSSLIACSLDDPYMPVNSEEKPAPPVVTEYQPVALTIGADGSFEVSGSSVKIGLNGKNSTYGVCLPQLAQGHFMAEVTADQILDRLKNAPNAEKRAGEIEEEKQAVIAALEEYEGI